MRSIALLLLVLALPALAADGPLTTPYLDAATGYSPQVARSRDGYAVAWINRETTMQAMVVRYDSHGQRLDTVALRAGDATGQRIAIASDGTEYVLAWPCRGRSSIEANVCVAHLTADGDLEQRETLTNAATPAIASDGTGYLLAFERASDVSVQGHTILARPLDGRGDFSGAEFLVQKGAQGPRIASNGSNYLIGWTATSTSAVLATETGVVSVPVMIGSGGLVYLGDAAFSSDGNDYLVAWTNTSNPAPSVFVANVLARRISGSTGALDHSTRTAASMDRPARNPRLAWAGDHYVMSYDTSRTTGVDPYAAGGDVTLIDLDRDGSPASAPSGVSDPAGPAATNGDVTTFGGETTVVYSANVLQHARVTGSTVTRSEVALTARSERNADIALSGDLAIVAFEQETSSGQTAVEFVRTGKPWRTPATRVRVGTGRAPAVAMSSAALVTWTEPSGTESRIVAVHVTRDGAVVGSPFVIASAAATATSDVVATRDGFTVVWPDRDGRILGARVPPAGQPFEAHPFLVSATRGGIDPRAAWMNGRMIVAWLTPMQYSCVLGICPPAYETSAVTLNDDGAARGEEARLARWASNPPVPVARTESFVVFWNGSHDDSQPVTLGGTAITRSGAIIGDVKTSLAGFPWSAVWDGGVFSVGVHTLSHGDEIQVVDFTPALQVSVTRPLFPVTSRRGKPDVALSGDGTLLVVTEKTEPLAPYAGATQLMLTALDGAAKGRAVRVR